MIAPRAHDVSLFQKIQGTIGAAERERLRSHEMAVAFRAEAFVGVFQISEWKGASAEFLDRSLQRKWTPLKQEIDRLVPAISVKTFPMDRYPELQTVKTHNEQGREVHSEASKAAARELNDLTSSRITQLDELDRIAARRLKVALSS